MKSARWRRMLLSAILGALVFGSWAYGANFDFPSHRLQAALAQGTFSFFFSFVIVALAELVFGLLAGKPFQVALSIAVPWATSVAGGYLVHRAAGTPSIGLTILGPALVGLVFGTFYVLNLKRIGPPRRPATSDGTSRDRPLHRHVRAELHRETR